VPPLKNPTTTLSLTALFATILMLLPACATTDPNPAPNIPETQTATTIENTPLIAIGGAALFGSIAVGTYFGSRKPSKRKVNG